MIAYAEKISLQKQLEELEQKMFDDNYVMTAEDYERYEQVASLITLETPQQDE